MKIVRSCAAAAHLGLFLSRRPSHSREICCPIPHVLEVIHAPSVTQEKLCLPSFRVRASSRYPKPILS